MPFLGGGGGAEGGAGQDKKKTKYEPPVPTRIGKKKKVKSGPDAGSRLPTITPAQNCKLRLLKLERIKDYLLLEEEFIQNQERLKPQEERHAEVRHAGARLGAPHRPCPHPPCRSAPRWTSCGAHP